jgi:hypothetical protein
MGNTHFVKNHLVKNHKYDLKKSFNKVAFQSFTYGVKNPRPVEAPGNIR